MPCGARTDDRAGRADLIALDLQSARPLNTTSPPLKAVRLVGSSPVGEFTPAIPLNSCVLPAAPSVSEILALIALSVDWFRLIRARECFDEG
jgi:hypothetical protein